MTVASMTGFARASGALDPVRWAWEVKTVNARGLDVRLRVPNGFDGLEAGARGLIGAALQRGTCYATLTVTRDAQDVVVRVNERAVDAVVQALALLRARVDAAPPSLDGLLAVKGVVELVEREDDEDSRAAQLQAVQATLEAAIAALVQSRRGEGAALEALLRGQLTTIERLTAAIEANPARSPEAIRERLAQQIRALFDAAPALDPDRLHQEAMLIAAKADVREELDRLTAHVAAARALLDKGGAVGRRLDFLAQELGRESNTLCAKSNDVTITALGLELKAVVEQFREQVQNLE